MLISRPIPRPHVYTVGELIAGRPRLETDPQDGRLVGFVSHESARQWLRAQGLTGLRVATMPRGTFFAQGGKVLV